MTRADHVSGTDRVAEVASAFEDVELVVNIQGDEPLIDPAAIDAAILPLLEEPAIPMGTLKKRIEDPREIADPNVVKVVTDRFENAIYFSRATIPYARDGGAPLSSLQTYRALCLPAGFSAAISRICRSGRWSRRSGWSSCGRSKTDSRSGWSRPITNLRRGYAGGSGTGAGADSTPCGRCQRHGGRRATRMAKFIFVTGGVVSSLGKGIAAASIGCLLESRGLTVSLQKFDPYLNVDPGTMSPFQHGEVFVTDDGAETDLDLGHYERFTHSPLTRANNLTCGRIYEQIIQRERRGDYLGKTVQVIPHVTNEIKAAIKKLSGEVDVVICEIGGTVGDIESLPFLEAIRQMRHEVGRENCIFVHVTLVPWITAAQELKTKPTQHSVKELRAIGIQPDILLCRAERFLPTEMKDKIALFCDVDPEAVITARDVDSVYEVPLRIRRGEGGRDHPAPSASRCQRARAISNAGAPCSTACRIRATRWTSRWSASTSSTRIPTRA